MKRLRSPVYLAGLYLLLAGAWVVLSDVLLARLGLDVERLAYFQQIKGLVFVVLTTLLLAVALQRFQHKLKRILKANHLNEERMILALDSAQEGLWDWDLQRDKVFFSPRYCQMLGLTQKEMGNTRADWENRLHPDDREPIRRLVDCHLASDGSRRYETTYRIRHRDGGYRWVRARGRLVLDPNGKPRRFIGTSLDVTSTRADQERLRQASAVFDCTHEGVIITDAQQRIVHINQAFSRITGYSAEETIGRDPRMFKSGVHDAAFYQKVWASILEQGAWSGEIWNRRKNGEVFPLWQSIRVVRDDNGLITHYVAVFSDISSIKNSQQELAFLAHHDPLTRLPNRLLIYERLQQTVRQVRRQGGSGALLLIDLDHFKHVNESFGHSAGDQLLQLVGDRLRAVLPEYVTLGRVGGDEFAVILAEGCPEKTADQVLDALREPFLVAGETLFVGASIGISLFPGDGEDVEALLRNADSALFNAKSAGRKTVSFYSEQMTVAARQRVRVEAELRQALAGGELRVYYQPIQRLEDRRMIGVEALVRWQHPQRGLVPPGEFVPLAEETGLIAELDTWVMAEACAQMKRWRDAGSSLRFVAVNVSSRLFARGGLEERVAEVLRRTGLPAANLELEVTESAIMENPQTAREVLAKLRDLGVRLAIDDFGTGYSSLARLKDLPVHKLKIDQSFIAGLPDNAGDAAITEAVISLGRNLGLSVLAEGIEEEHQAGFLGEHGCMLGQGYLFGRPQPAEQLEQPQAGESAASL